MPKQTIAVDIDDVLAAFAESFVYYCNQKWGTNLVPDDWTEDWAKLWKVDHLETLKRADVIYESDIFSLVRADIEAARVLKNLAKTYKLVVVTSRPKAVSKDTLEWIEKFFGDVFEEIHFAGFYDDMEKTIPEKLKATKADIARQIGAQYLIDDSPKHCLAVAEAGITSILFGDYKWNRHIKLGPNMVRAKNWKEVEAYFDNRGGR